MSDNLSQDQKVFKEFNAQYMMKKKTEELDLQRQKNQDIGKHVAKTLEIKEKENKYLTDLINDLRRQIANRHQTMDKAIQMTANSTMTSPTKTSKASPTKNIMNLTQGSISERANNLYNNINYNNNTKVANELYEDNITSQNKINLPNIDNKGKKTDVGIATFSNRIKPTKETLIKSISQRGLSSTRSMNSLMKYSSLPRIHKGKTSLPENNTRKVLDEKRWEEMNRA